MVSSPKTAHSLSFIAANLDTLSFWRSKFAMAGELGSNFNSGKKSVVGDRAASEGSSQRIQSSKEPKLNAFSAGRSEEKEPFAGGSP